MWIKSKENDLFCLREFIDKIINLTNKWTKHRFSPTTDSSAPNLCKTRTTLFWRILRYSAATKTQATANSSGRISSVLRNPSVTQSSIQHQLLPILSRALIPTYQGTQIWVRTKMFSVLSRFLMCLTSRMTFTWILWTGMIKDPWPLPSMMKLTFTLPLISTRWPRYLTLTSVL